MVKVIDVNGNGIETATVELDDFTMKTLHPHIAEMLEDASTDEPCPRRTSSVPKKAHPRRSRRTKRTRPRAGPDSSNPGQRGARGMPKPTMAMMSRWISLVPPPKVKMVWLRALRSSRPWRTAPGDPSVR